MRTTCFLLLVLCVLVVTNTGCSTTTQQATESSVDSTLGEGESGGGGDPEAVVGYFPIAPFYHEINGQLSATDGTFWYLLQWPADSDDKGRPLPETEQWQRENDYDNTFYRTSETFFDQTQRPVFIQYEEVE